MSTTKVHQSFIKVVVIISQLLLPVVHATFPKTISLTKQHSYFRQSTSFGVGRYFAWFEDIFSFTLYGCLNDIYSLIRKRCNKGDRMLANVCAAGWCCCTKSDTWLQSLYSFSSPAMEYLRTLKPLATVPHLKFIQRRYCSHLANTSVTSRERRRAAEFKSRISSGPSFQDFVKRVSVDKACVADGEYSDKHVYLPEDVDVGNSRKGKSASRNATNLDCSRSC